MNQSKPIALISVYDKAGIVTFAQNLIELGWQILSSGGTAKHLSQAGIPVAYVEELTGMPAILEHRVATLHPAIHAGLLARETNEHEAELKQYGFPRIDLVCVDFYPLEEEIANPGATKESVVEKTDIGGPTLVRAGAKGRRITICDPEDRETVIDWLQSGKPDEHLFIDYLVCKAEMNVGAYVVSSYYYHASHFAEKAQSSLWLKKLSENLWLDLDVH